MIHDQILIVEDEGLVAEDIKAHLEENGWQVPAIVPSGEAALEILQGTHIDLVMMDIVLSGTMDGIQTAEIIRNKHQIPVVYLTAYTDPDKIERAATTNSYGYLVKPFDERELKTTVSIGLSKASRDKVIEEKKRWAQSVLRSIEDGVITTDSYGNVRDINPKACEMLQIRAENSIGQQLKNVLNFNDPATQQHLINALGDILESLQHSEYHFDGELQGLNEKIIDAKLSGITDENGNIEGIVTTFHDVTLERRAHEKLSNYNTELEQRVAERTEEISHALDKAQAAIIAKDRFIGNISHELRTPLNPISTLSQIMMLKTVSADKQKELAETIYQSSLDLVDMIDNLILLSELDGNDFIFEESSFNVLTLLNESLNKYRKQAKDKNISIIVTPPDNDIGQLIGDYAQLKSIIGHLVDNAIKFTESGTVRLKIEILNNETDSMKLRFIVQDDGPGISKDIAHELFQRFTQGDDSNTKSKKGMGIGLSLSKLLVEHMGGRIQARNRKNGGTEFWFDLCLMKA